MSIPTEGPLALWLREYNENEARIAQAKASGGGGRGTASPAPRPRDVVPPTDPLGRLSTDHPEVFNLVAESLIARGALGSLASLNSASYPLYEATLPLLWRTFIWDAYGKGKTKTDEYWKRCVGSRGAEHIRFFVDRSNRSNSKHKNLPRTITHLPSYKNGTLKAYVAEFDDLRAHFVKHNQRKVVVHLLPAYEPIGFGKGGDQDYITVRHALIHLSPPPGAKRPKKKQTGNPCDDTSVGYAFYIIHPSPSSSQRFSPLPNSIDEYAACHPLPVLPVTLDAVLLAPSAKAFTETDKPRLSHIAFEFLASMDHEPRTDGVEWNGFVGEFTTQRIKEEERCRSYIEFHWQEGVESMIICAQAAADALNPFRQSESYNWIELQFSNHDYFPHDNAAIHTILETLQAHYLLHAPRRLHPPDHNMGDVVVQDISRDLLAALKRVVPGRRRHSAESSQTHAKAEEEDGRQAEGTHGGAIATEAAVKPESSEADKDKMRETDKGQGSEKENDKQDGTAAVESTATAAAEEAEETRNVVEYFIKRYAPGEGWKTNTVKTFHDSHDPERVVFYKEFPM